MPTQTKTGTDAVAMLKADHDKVQDLFKQFFELGERAIKSKQKLAEQIFQELEVHTRLEEEIFYPAARQCSPTEEDVVEEGLEEHHVVDLIIAEIKALTPEDETYDAKFKVLCENVQHHIEEEEKEMLPEAKRCLGSEQIQQLGEQMKSRRQELMQPAGMM